MSKMCPVKVKFADNMYDKAGSSEPMHSKISGHLNDFHPWSQCSIWPLHFLYLYFFSIIKCSFGNCPGGIKMDVDK